MTVEEFLREWNDGSERIMVHTSGSTGNPKPMWVEKQRMEASARITCQFLGLQPGDTALLCLPLDFIAGKMMVVRAITQGLLLFTTPPSSHPLLSPIIPINPITPTTPIIPTPPITPLPPITFAAMVPMQVINSLKSDEERRRLASIKHLIIGGGPIDDGLANELRAFPNAVWSTYGMTETLSHIALRRLSGPEATEWYTPFEGISLTIDDIGANDIGANGIGANASERLNSDKTTIPTLGGVGSYDGDTVATGGSPASTGRLIINAPHVCAGRLTTNDIAELRPDGTFRILGRTDNVVCSGGVKIQIEEVERIIRQHTTTPLMATKCPDPLLGEALVLLTESTDTEPLRHLCHEVLPQYWQPRHYLSIAHLPTTANGKPSRAEAQLIASKAI